MILLSMVIGAGISVVDLTAAQPAPPEEPILVEGQRRVTQKEALRTVTDMTMSIESQIARFHGPVCPLVVGLEPAAAAIVQERIRKTSKELGTEVAAGKCEANLTLFIAGDGANLFNDIRAKRPRWLENVPVHRKMRLAKEGPVRSWAVTNFRKKSPSPYVERASFLQSAMQRYIDGSAVIVDADAIEGLSLAQLADYATMRGLAQIQPPQNVGRLDSILSIFDRPKGTGPRELTAFDRRYLRELYEHLDNKGYERSVHERYRLARAVAAGE